MASKLPSGRYRVQVFIGRENGKRKYKSFTATTEKKARLAALQWQAEHPSAAVSEITLGAAMKSFIKSRKAVLSPSTVTGYSSIERTINARYKPLCLKKIDMISTADLQSMIDDLISRGVKPKTCRNYIGFLSAVWKSRNLTIPEVTLPAKVKPQYNIPDADTLNRLYKAAKGTALEVPIYLASIGPMRRGEIVGATMDDLEGNILHVRRTVVQNPDGTESVRNATKTYSSTRDIPLPDDLVEKIRKQGYICNLSLKQLSDRFERLVKRCGFPHFRFHDLRHAFVSICHAEGIPDAYIQHRGGWATNYTMNNVYRHTLQKEELSENEKINSIFKSLE